MPYALRESGTGQLLACMQVNGYQLAYYGVRLWESVPDEAAIQEALAAAGVGGLQPEAGGSDLLADAGAANALVALWQPVDLTEHQAKMANVKLRNDPRRRVFLQDNVLTASAVE